VAFDEEFKPWLDRYKYADRCPEQTPDDYRGHAENWLICLEGPLGRCGFLAGDKATLTDVALFPFVRQFAGVIPPGGEVRLIRECMAGLIASWYLRSLPRS